MAKGDWVEPWDAADPLDVAACARKLDFTIAWFADPVYRGAYPASMAAQLGDRLPRFTDDEAALVKGSNDYYGMNHYTADYVKHNAGPAPREDAAGNLSLLKANKAGQSIGPETQSVWLRPHPAGFRKLLRWISERYGGPRIFVTENGTSVKGESELSLEDALRDEFRAQYFRDYVGAMVDARCEDGVDVIGYLAWSLLE
jgi:beta-glucosidase